MDYKTAARIASDIESIRGQLNDALLLIQKACPDEEFKRYRRAVGSVMADLLLEVGKPIYNEHPSLMPAALARTKDDRGSEG